ncbi:MAG: betaine--homocysteine S-methyltransferase [Pseudomonadota bacterium]
MSHENLLSCLLAERPWLLADGATGTSLFNMGLEAGDAPELWNVDQPEKINALYKGWLDAGSDIFLTNTFGGNGARLKLHGAQDRVLDLNTAGAAIGRDMVDASDRQVVVAGSMGPTGEIMEPMGALTYDTAVDLFHEQAEGLKAGGADVAWIETISDPQEFKAAAEGCRRADLPWCGTMSFDTAGRTMMGFTSEQLAALIAELPSPPVAYGANCGVGASDLLRTVLGFSPAIAPIPVIAKGNAGIPKYVDGHIHYDGTPELMAHYACLARDAGARIIGGCCGTTPRHIEEMRTALETRPAGNLPSHDEITAQLGAFSSENDGTGATDTGGRTRRRRRR